ncbi:hypothetical protein GCM10007079_07160 [Nocardiopsis terrae]|nr:hypothetical protein GCM10007079_07160 [Nocardiopsis terrae]
MERLQGGVERLVVTEFGDGHGALDPLEDLWCGRGPGVNENDVHAEVVGRADKGSGPADHRDHGAVTGSHSVPSECFPGAIGSSGGGPPGSANRS